MSTTLLKYIFPLLALCIGMATSSGDGDKPDIGTTSTQGDGEDKVIMNNINLYYDPLSPPCRSVLLTLEALKLQFNLKYISLLKKDNLKEDFRKINPLHTIPVLEAGDFVLLESHAIIVYLVRKYGGKEDHPLYPNDPEIQAQIDQRLHFDNGTLYPPFKIQYNGWAFFRIEKTEERELKIHEALQFLEGVLEKTKWAASNSITVADFALVASISTFVVNGVDLTKYTKINEWLENCKNEMLGYNSANESGLDKVKIMLKELDAKHLAQSTSQQK